MATLGPLKRPLRWLRRWLPPLNFITIHYAYFIGTCLLAAIIFWGSSTPARSVSFTDSLFLVVSAMTLAGLNTINLSTLNTFQQFMLFFLIIIGSAIFVSAFVVHVRRRAFEKKFEDVIARQRQRQKQRRRGSSSRRTLSMHRRPTHDLPEHDPMPLPAVERSTDAEEASDTKTELDAIKHSEDEISPRPSEKTALEDGPSATLPSLPSPPLSSAHRRRPSFLSFDGVGAVSSRITSPTMTTRPVRTPPIATAGPSIKFELPTGWIARNSQFHSLSARERERLGGYEYRAVCLLSWLVPAYFVLWQLLGCLGCAAWVAINRPETARANGLNPWWVGAFNAVSAFNNSGMSLLDANMTAFQTAFYLLITMGLLILAGNTCYPVFLRLIVWTMLKVVSRLEGEQWRERAATLRFLLDHPRRCYTNLFPSQHTWWLLLSVVTLNGVDWAAFEILNIGNPKIDDVLPVNVRVIDGLFQAFAVRSGGFYVVVIPTVRISLQVLYVVMMYISVYPVVITMRNSNVYEERSLGIYSSDDPGPYSRDLDTPVETRNLPLLRRVKSTATSFLPGRESNALFVRHQLRAQLAHDSWIIVLALFVIMIIEGSKFNADPATYSVFNYIFEIVSGYGCVGISVGVPWDAYSFCGSWKTGSKLVLCAVMLRGRHRGLPVAIDRAVLLPGDKDEDEEMLEMRRRGSGRDGGV